MRSAFVTVLFVVGLSLHTSVASAAPTLDRPAYAQRVLELTNVERQHAGLGPLVLNPQLNLAAQRYTEVLASGSCFEHTCGAVPDFADRISEAGYAGSRMLAENIAAGYPTPEAVVAGWMSSPGHRRNILTPGFTEMGVGVVGGAPGKFGTYWTQEFGARPVADALIVSPDDAEGGDPVDGGSGI